MKLKCRTISSKATSDKSIFFKLKNQNESSGNMNMLTVIVDAKFKGVDLEMRLVIQCDIIVHSIASYEMF